jgi:CRISPR system Cascade subunit CasE
MASEPSELHLASLRLDLPRLIARARESHLPVREIDSGYLVHSALAGLFGDDAPAPFAEMGTKGRFLELLGYSTKAADALRARADDFAHPDLHAACEWDRFTSKPFRTNWSVGHRLAFRTRVCPVVRRASERLEQDRVQRKGSEVDAFLAKCEAAGDSAERLDRETVYREWLSGQLERGGGALLVSARLIAFRRARFLRREQGAARKARFVERPDATFGGELEVTEPAAFARLLARGLGRHRAFGFGMLLLRPAARRPC